MALQDLTPQLRTRLSRMERAVGWFVILATALLVFGFGYYAYNTAERKGWFLLKARYFTFTDRATGLKVGDPVMLMGFGAGEITEIKPMPADQFEYNVYIEFELKAPNFGYMWTEGSRAKVATADLLGKRVLEVTKGTGGYPTYLLDPFREIPTTDATTLPEWEQWQIAEDLYDGTGTNLVIHAFSPLSKTNLATVVMLDRKSIRVIDRRKGEAKTTFTAIWNDHDGRYDPFTKTTRPYWLKSDESAAVTERLESLVGEVERALPNFLRLTNQLATALGNTATLASNFNEVAISAQPAVSNLAAATAQLDRPGALGEWLLPTNVNQQLEATLGSAHSTLSNANTNLTALAENLERTLDNLAGITSNLHYQVQANTNMLSEISRAVIDADDLVQGLKRHWLLRSAFKNPKTNAPSAVQPGAVRSPKDASSK